MVKPAVECAGCDPSNSVCLLFNNKIAISLACCFIERTKTMQCTCSRFSGHLSSSTTCLVLLVQIWKWANFYATFVLWILHDVIVVWPGSCNLLQDGQTRAIVAPNSVAIWRVQMLRSFGRGWQMLGEKCCEYVGLKCCNRLTEAL